MSLGSVDNPVQLTPYQQEDVATNQQNIPLPYLAGERLVALRWTSPAINQQTRQAQGGGKKGGGGGSSKKGSSSSSPQNLDYYGTISGAFCWGPLDWLTALIVNGNYVWQCDPTSGPLQLAGALDANGYLDLTGALLDPTLIVGGGYLKLMGGVDYQQPDGALPNSPGYADSAGIVANGIFFGQGSGSAPNIQMVGGRCPRVDTSIVAAIDNVVNDRQVNPIAALAEILLDERGGDMGLSELNAASWLVAGHWCAQDQAHMDYSFISPLFNGQMSLGDVVKALLDHIDGNLYWAADGTLAIQIYEWGTDPGGLTTLDARYFTKEPKIVDGDWVDAKTEYVVSFTDRAYEFQGNTVQIADTVVSNIRQVTDVGQLARSQVTRGPQAQSQGNAYKDRMGLMPGTGTLFVRAAYAAGFYPGGKLKYNDEPVPSSTADAQLARIEKITADRTDEVQIDITIDPLLPGTPYAPAWTSPLPETTFGPTTETCPSLQYMQAIPLPPDTFGWPPSVGFLATRSNLSQCGFNAYFSTSSSGAYDLLGAQSGFAARVSLVNAIGTTDNPIRLQLLDGATGPDAYLAAETPGGNATQAANDDLLAILFQLDGSGNVAIDGGGNPIMEFCSIEQRSAISTSVHDYTVLRGRCSLVARAWSSGAVGWIVPKVNLTPWQHNLFATLFGDTAYFRLAAFTSAAVDESSPLPGTEMIFPVAYDADQPAAYTVILSADAVTVACDSSGSPLSGQLGSGSPATASISVLQNGVALTPVSASPNPTEFSISLGTLTNTTAVIDGTDGIECDSLTADTGTIAVNILIGGAFTVTKIFTLTKAIAGATGATGTTGATGNTSVTIYIADALVPSTPTGNNPSGWSTSIPSTGGTTAIWASSGVKNPSGVLVGSWSTPERVSGSVIFYPSGISTLTTSVATLMVGDTAFDISDNNKIYRWNGTSWVAAFTPFLNSSGGVISGVTTVGGSGPFLIQATDLQVYNGATGDVPFEIVTGVTYIKNAMIQEIAAGKITAGTIQAAISLGSAGSLSSGSGANAFYNDVNGTVLGDPSGVHFTFETDGTQTNLFLYNGGTLKGFWTYNGGAGLTTFDAGGGHIQNASNITGNEVTANGTADSRTVNTSLVAYGGAYISKSLDVLGKSYFGDTLQKETDDGWTPILNAISGHALCFQWDGSDTHVKVDASDFIFPHIGAGSIPSTIAGPSGVSIAEDAEARTAINSILSVLSAWRLMV